MEELSRSEEMAERIIRQVAGILPHRLPVATYRLQFNKSFRFTQAHRIVSYLRDLGITDVYASPLFLAQPGSMHGYDLTDYGRLNQEIGNEQEFETYTAELRRHGLGQILDIVPNHMSIGGCTNRWWQDVLENGRSSPYAASFDIDWQPVKEELENKVLLPILGDQYGRILENGELRLSLQGGGFQLSYYQHCLPLDPKTYVHILGYRLEELQEALAAADKDLQELLSVITALGHLPERIETDPEQVAERRREKEIIKRRIAELYSRSEAIRSHLDGNIEIFNGKPGEPESFDLLDRLLADQVFRLASWRVATEEINYRRFFDVNDLAAVRMESSSVFREAHVLLFKWVRKGKVTGLRVDHPDGLYNPTAYFRKLQGESFIQLCLAAAGRTEEDEPDFVEKVRARYWKEVMEHPDSPFKRPFYIVGEKILMDGEPMPPYWPIFGATGYGFMNAVNGLFVDRRQAKAFTRIYARFTGEERSFSDLVRQTKKLIMRSSMASEINVLGHSLNRISENDRYFRDFTLQNLTQAITEVITLFPIYRTYIDERGAPDRDRRYLEAVIARAKRLSREVSGSIFDFLGDVLLLRYPERADESLREQCLNFTMKFQQLTGPVMAKGMEDTAFYIYNRLVSLNEVGGNPERFGLTVESFHARNEEMLSSWPHTLLATSTHDSKRGEDVRARLNVLSEMPDRWHEHLVRWSRRNRRWKTVLDEEPYPERNTEYLLYQTLIGAWPLEAMDEDGLGSFGERIVQYMLKAAREAKTHTSWINQNADYEEALTRFIKGLLSHPPFLEDFLPFQKEISHLGLLNSLAQTLLKITSPGVPDFYQGTELWAFTLVDPDNRAPVDYERRADMLRELQESEAAVGRLELARDLVRTLPDGRIKLFLTCKALNFRREHQDLFRSGRYVPLRAEGPGERHLVSFLRVADDAAGLVVVPRLLADLATEPERLPLGKVWHDTELLLPGLGRKKSVRNVLTGEEIQIGAREDQPCLLLTEILAHFPVALLELC